MMSTHRSASNNSPTPPSSNASNRIKSATPMLRSPWVDSRLSYPGDSVGKPDALPATGDFRTDLIALLTQLGSWLSRADLGAMHTSLLTEARRDPQLSAVRKKLIANRRQRIVAVIEGGIGEGTLPPDTPATRMAHDVAAPLFYRGLVTREPLDGAFIEAHVDRWIRLYRSGVA